MVVLAGLAAAAISYLLNRWLVNRFGPQTIVFITPIIEEVAKTGLAVLLGAAILPVHLLFGLIEGIYDFTTSRFGVTAGILSLVWHSTFGLVTVWLRSAMGNLAYGVLAAILLHYLGNSLFVKPKEERQ